MASQTLSPAPDRYPSSGGGACRLLTRARQVDGWHPSSAAHSLVVRTARSSTIEPSANHSTVMPKGRFRVFTQTHVGMEESTRNRP